MTWHLMGTVLIQYHQTYGPIDTPYDKTAIMVPIPRAVMQDVSRTGGTTAFGHLGRLRIWTNGTYWGTSSQILLTA